MVDAIRDFIRLIGHDPDISPVFVENIVKNLSESRTIELIKFANMIYNKIPYISEEIQSSMVPTAISGGYGAFFECSINGTRCFKKVFVNATASKKYMFVKELFIQHFLSRDPDFGHHVPKIFGIYRMDPFLVIEMERADRDVENFIYGLMLLSTPFNIFYKITHTAFTILKHFNERYNFVHRDFKLNNLVLRKIEPGIGADLNNSLIQIIDFGFSCLTVTVNGTAYNIVAGGRYNEGVPCRQQQDVIFFLYYMLIYGRPDANIATFINNFITPAFITKINARLSYSPYHKAYNNTGNLFGEVNLPNFTIARLLDSLATAAAAATSANAAAAAASPENAVGSNIEEEMSKLLANSSNQSAGKRKRTRRRRSRRKN